MGAGTEVEHRNGRLFIRGGEASRAATGMSTPDDLGGLLVFIEGIAFIVVVFIK